MPVIAMVAAVSLAATVVVDGAADDVVDVPAAVEEEVPEEGEEEEEEALATIIVEAASDPVSVLVGMTVAGRFPLMVLVTFAMLELPPVAPVSSKSGEQL